MVVKMIKLHPLIANDIGDEVEFNDEYTKILLDGGYAVPVKQDKTETTASKVEPEKAVSRKKKK